MKRSLLTYLILSLFASLGFAQKETRNDAFDIKKFKSQEVNNEVNYTSKDSFIVRQIRDKDRFIEEIRKPNNPFTFYKSYYKDSGLLKTSVTHFHSFPIGNLNEYDESGKLINSTDFDKNYKFSIYDLAKKVKSEFSKDIMVSNLGLIVNRGYEKIPYYEVYIPLGPFAKSNRRVIKFDGNNGNILSDINKEYDDGVH